MKHAIYFSEPAFAIGGVKDEMALEALAVGRNADFMAYLDQVSARARSGERHSLKDIQEEFGGQPAPPPRRRKRG